MTGLVCALALAVFGGVRSPFDGARWVWPSTLGSPTNTVVEFKRDFVMPQAGEATLVVAADAVYSVSLNGRFVHTGRLPDVPPMRFYDELPLKGLVAGTNELVVAVYAQGEGSFQYLEGDPGLLYALDAGGVRLTSGTADVWRVSSAYRREGVPLITRQLGFSFDYDAAAPARPWQAVGAVDARRGPECFDLRPRPVARVAIEPALPTCVIGQGALEASPVPEAVASGMDGTALHPCPAEEFFADADRSVRPSFFADGFFVTVDLGREEAGLLTLEVETDAGAVIDIGHAEHLEDGRIRTFVGNRNFAGRYRTREGRQSFCHWVHRMAGRFIQLHVRGVKTRFVLKGLSVCPTVFPVEEAPVPERLSAEERAIWKTSVRTLRLCLHEHYEDCPWREQALYANDSRNQMLAGYFGFTGNSGMPELALELLSRGIDERGWIELCMPAKIGLAIPSFTFSWVLAVGDHLKYRHDLAFIKSMMPSLRSVLDRRRAELTSDLLPCPVGKRYWQFYDWVKDLSGNSRCEGDVSGNRFEAPLNLFAVLAFESGARCADAVGDVEAAARWRQAAARIRSAVRAKFWNADKRQVETRLGASLAPAELSQALALLADAVPPEARAGLVEKLSHPSDWTATSLSQSLYKYEALLAAGGAAAESVRRDIREIWTEMLKAGATSFWEVREGWKAFGAAGSLCHGWSAIPVYFYGAYPELFRDDPYVVSWNGKVLEQRDARVSAVPMCRVWPGHQRELSQTEMARFVRFDVESNGTVVVRAPGLAAKFRHLLPLSAERSVTTVGTDELRVAIPDAGARVLTFDGLPTLHLLADPPLPPVPTPASDGRLIRFERGSHYPGVVRPRSGDVVVLDEGAVVYGALFIHQATNVTVTGRGIFDASGLTRADERIKAVHCELDLPEIDTESACFPYAVYASENVTISGVTFRDPPFWTLVIRNHCRNTLVDNIHILGNWRYNSDGIDVCASADTVIRNSFIRTFDDCLIARGPYLKGESAPVSNLVISNCTLYCDWGVVVKAQVQDFHGSTIENVLVRDCKVPAMREAAFFLATRYGCDLDIIRNFTAEDVELDFLPQPMSQYQRVDNEEFVPRPQKTASILSALSYTLGKNLDNQVNGRMEDPDYYRFIYENFRFSRFKTYGESRRLKINLKADVPRHEIRNVVLEDLPPYELLKKGNVSGVITR